MVENAPEPGKAVQDFKYDAYIACHQAEPDLTIARRLAAEINSYKLPKGVFSPESALCFDDIVVQNDTEAGLMTLSDNVRYLLMNSRHLILVCSPRTKDSLYVHSLIDYFTALGRKPNIIPVLAEGEPLCSFPPQFFESKTIQRLRADGQIEQLEEVTEPLAADIRSNTLKKSLKLLRHARLKVIAALIGCAYDDLERRHYKRAHQRLVSLLAFFGSVMILITITFSYLALKALHQAQISREQTQMANDVLNKIYVEMPEAFSDLPEAWPLVQNLMLENAENLLQENKQKAETIDLSSLLTRSPSDNFELNARKAILMRQLGKGEDGLKILLDAAESESLDEAYKAAAKWLYQSSNEYGAALFAADLTDGGAALEAGIEPGDIIVGINGKSFVSTEAFTRFLRESDQAKLTVTYLHKGQNGYSEKKRSVYVKNGRLGISYLPL